MKIRNALVVRRQAVRIAQLLSVLIIFGCSNADTTNSLSGKWQGYQYFTFEEKVVPDSARTLEEALGTVVTSTEVQDSVIFNFDDDSVWVTTSLFKSGLLFLPDEQNKDQILLLVTNCQKKTDNAFMLIYYPITAKF